MGSLRRRTRSHSRLRRDAQSVSTCASTFKILLLGGGGCSVELHAQLRDPAETFAVGSFADSVTAADLNCEAQPDQIVAN
jgi:hypothetical protein